MPYPLRIVLTWLRHVARRGRRSLVGRLALTLVGLFAVLAGIQVRDHVARLQLHERLRNESYLKAATGAAALLRSNLWHVHHSHRALMQALDAQHVPPDQALGFLRDFQDQYPGAVAMEVADPGGKILFGTLGIGFDPDLSDDPFFSKLTTRSPVYVSDLYTPAPGEEPRFRVVSLIEGQPLDSSFGEPPAASPYPETETTAHVPVAGYVATEFHTPALKDLLEMEDRGATAVLLDGEGHPLYSNRTDGAVPGVAARPAVAAAVHTRRPAKVQVAERGDALVGYAVPVPETDWTLVYLRHRSEALAGADIGLRESIVALAWVVAALTVVLLAVLALSVRPLIRLSAATHKLGAGDLDFRLPAAEVEEFEPLVAAFNRMAERLQGAQQQLLEANRGLEERVRDRTRALQVEHEKLLRAERLSTLGLFSSAIAHDLRNPLNTVNLSVHWLKIRLGDGVDERVKTRLETIERELARSERIIKTLLAFARTGEPERAPLDVNTLIRDVLEVIHPPAGFSLDASLASQLPQLYADRAQLFQVLENLLRNALQAMQGGGTVTVCSERQEGCIRISVADTGPGIPEDVLGSVFEPLVTTKTTGTGLGLALCKRIVEAHEGRIWAENAAEGGAVFRIDLPLQAEERTAPAESLARAAGEMSAEAARR